MNNIKGLFYLDGAPVAVEITGDRIGEIRRVESRESGEQVYIAPGFIDNQVNGYVSVGFTDPDLTVEKIKEATSNLWKVGVTTYLPTVITADRDRLLQNFAVLAEAMEQPAIRQSVPGFHLEGPYISPEDGYRGAHTRAHVRPPDWKEFQELNTAAGGHIIQVSLAPETTGALDFIRQCRQQGITVALAHHNAGTEIITRATDAGAAISTHLGNGCANTIHRHRNPLWGQLAEDRLMASLIVDGFHLTPEEVRTFYRVKGPDRIVLVSDMTQLAGMPPGEYSWDQKTVVLKEEGVILYPEQAVLAGAASPLVDCVGNMMRYTGCTLNEAVKMASANPARLNHLTDRGVLQTGHRADLILFTLEDGHLRIRETYIAGQQVYAASETAV